MRGKLVCFGQAAAMMLCITAAAAQVPSASGPTSVEPYVMPDGVADPNEAIKHWSYSDPVFLWRLTSVPENMYEPPAYFYWPDAVIKGKPAPFFPQAKAPAISPDALDKMVAWAEEKQSNALIVIHKGELVLEKYWNQMTPKTLANGRAITRSMAPMLLGFAVAEGKVSLSDELREYIPQWQDDPRGKITVQQVAQHVTGLEQPERLPASEVFGNKLLCLFYCGDVNRAALELSLIEPPGQHFNVADQNMQLLAMVIEAAMDTPIQDLLSERVWQRIGARDATFQLDRPGGTARAICCMRANPRDWTRLGVFVMQGGRWQGEQVLPAGWVEQMATPSPKNANFGIGLWLGSPYNPLRSYYHGKPGVIPMSEPYLVDDVRIMEGGGFRVLYMSPSRELVIFRHGVFVSDWDGAYLMNTALRGMEP